MKPEKDKDYYLHGGVEKHPVDGFTVYGTVYGEPWKMPATIDDPVILEEITEALRLAGYAI